MQVSVYLNISLQGGQTDITVMNSEPPRKTLRHTADADVALCIA
jgi:hypothetical protein